MSDQKKINNVYLDKCKDGNIGHILQLIDQVDIDCTNGSGNTALILAATAGHLDVVKLLIERGADINFEGHEGNTALIYISTMHCNEIMKYFIDMKADVNLQNIRGITALMDAAKEGDSYAVDLLIKNGVDVNLFDNDNNIALMLAVKRKQHVIVNSLINACADVNIINSGNQTAIEIANDIHDYISMVLINNDMGNRTDMCGNTLLIKACKNRNEKTVIFLHERGFDFNVENDAGCSAFYFLDNWENPPPAIAVLKEKLSLEVLIDEEEHQSISI